MDISKKTIIAGILLFLLVIAATILFLVNPLRHSGDTARSESNPQYLLFQLTNVTPEISGGSPSNASTKTETQKMVGEIVTAIGQVGDHVHTQLGFTVGPLMFDLTDQELRTLIADSFAVAEEKNVAVAFHIDDSMFWNRRQDLWSDKNNVEWSDWNGTAVAHRIIGWVADGKSVLAPPMCYTSPAIKTEAARIARDVIGPAIKKGIDHLNTINKPYLFAGVMAGWETRMQDDSTINGMDGIHYGYCALHTLGYRASNPPANIDLALQEVVSAWVTLWTKGLVDGGVSKAQIFTHIAFPPEVPPSTANIPADTILRQAYKDSDPSITAYTPYSSPGFSIYGVGAYSRLYTILAKHPSGPWGISEGTNLNLANSFDSNNRASTYTMEQYLGGAFNHGATYVNLFGWDTSFKDEFAEASARSGAIAAYQKFLQGQSLMEP